MTGKRVVFCVVLALVSMGIYSQSMSIDEAISITATEMGQRLQKNSQIAVLNFSSKQNEISAYVVDEMNNAIVRTGSLTVVDRHQLDLARKELNFNMSGEVSDESAQRIGKFLGAQLVMTGSLTEISGTYRFRIQVIVVETGVVQYSNSLTIKNDDYTFGERLGIGLLNIFFGAGSFMIDDSNWGTGLLYTQLFGSTAAGIFAWLFTSTFNDSWDWAGADWKTIGTTVGITYGIIAIVGIGRAFFVQKPDVKIGYNLPIDINLVLASSSDVIGVQMVYKLSF